jgi:hypothetical protein
MFSDESRKRFINDREKRRRTKGPKTDNGSGRERNVAHEKSEEHSRVPKGNRKTYPKAK